MKKIFNSGLFEKALIFIFIFIFLVFAVVFTVLDLKETENKYNNQRLEYTKKLADEIRYLIDNRIDVSYKLSNALSENSVAYAVVHLADGTVLARSEGYALPVGIFVIAESNALKADYLNLFPFKDSSGKYSIVEASIPIFSREGYKYVLRLGFLKNDEEDKISILKLRNILVFTLILVFFISVRKFNYFSFINIRYVILISMTLIMMVLFFVSSFIMRQWYISSWRSNFISNECINLSKMIIPSAVNLIERNSLSDVKASAKLLEENKDFQILSIIKDDIYVYHSDSNKVGQEVLNEYYRKSLNSNKPCVFKHNYSEEYTAVIPIMNGSSRIGSICTVWKNYTGLESFSTLRNKLTMVFVFAYLLLYWFLRRFSDEFIRTNTNGRANNSLFNENFFKKSSEEKQTSENKMLGASVFIYFSGLLESIEKNDKDVLSLSVEDCLNKVKSILADYKSYILRLESDGIFVLFNSEIEQDAVFEAIEFSKKAKNELCNFENLPFSPKITIHICKMLYLNENTNKEPICIGDCKIDYKSIAKVQSRNDIIVSKEAYNMLNSVARFDAVELISLESGKYNVYLLGDFYESKELLDNFSSLSEWTKLMILRILKYNGDVKEDKLNELFTNIDSKNKHEQ